MIEACEIENLHIISSFLQKYTKYQSKFLYFVKLICIDNNKKKNNISECLKIGTTNVPSVRFKQFRNEFSPNPTKISVIFIANLFDARNEDLESLFKNFNKEMIDNSIKKKNGKNSTEIYLYNQSMINNFYIFFKEIEHKLWVDSFYLNNHYFKSIEKFKLNIGNIMNDCVGIKRSLEINNNLDKRLNIFIENKILNINEFSILDCPKEITFDLLKSSQFAIFYDDLEAKMVGWYKATMKEFECRNKNKPNCTFLVEYNKMDFIQNLFISKTNYGFENLWILIE